MKESNFIIELSHISKAFGDKIVLDDVSLFVKKGEFVNQGQIIGNIGNTGITTGPHLHYEVHIGSDVVDPAKYINVKLLK